MKTCATCQNAIGSRNRTGLCKRCWGIELRRRSSADPEVEARRAASARAAMIEVNRSYWGDPINSARQAAYCATKNRARANPNPKRSAAALAWCPPAYRELNALLLRKHFTKAERQAMVAENIKRDRERGQREVAQITAEMQARHERQKAQAW